MRVSLGSPTEAVVVCGNWERHNCRVWMYMHNRQIFAWQKLSKTFNTLADCCWLLRLFHRSPPKLQWTPSQLLSLGDQDVSPYVVLYIMCYSVRCSLWLAWNIFILDIKRLKWLSVGVYIHFLHIYWYHGVLYSVCFICIMLPYYHALLSQLHIDMFCKSKITYIHICCLVYSEVSVSIFVLSISTVSNAVGY